MPADVLPDSRARDSKNIKWSATHQCYFVQLFCANCGSPYGFVPEHVSFAVAICNKCEANHGAPAHLQRIPDELIWDKVTLAMTEQEKKQSRPMTTKDVLIAIDTPGSDFAKLAKEWQSHLRNPRARAR